MQKKKVENEINIKTAVMFIYDCVQQNYHNESETASY